MTLESTPVPCRRQIPEAGPSRVVFNRKVGPGWLLLRLEEPAIARAAAPGSFVEVLCAVPGSYDPLLRRPFSVYDADPAAGTYDLLYIATGRGTRWMAALPELPELPEEGGSPPAHADVIGPFGNRFTPPPAGATALLVGGGVGVAPLYFFARELCASRERPAQVILCMGARAADQLQGIEEFRKLPIRSEVSTDDGSAGFHGLVTGLLEHLLDRDLKGGDPRRITIYGCGPTAMNESLRRVAIERKLWCEICVEARMACGFGICFACVVPIQKSLGGAYYNRRICLEGPVFDARLLKPGLGEHE
ncbi:MAG: dihydroorotate dehydrogenase electron transfer subunit [Planctomycetes bacterium]|nr:dihydroorotate dehydrogenase electron transfer subunit [Planctomycetota bacterium]